MNIEPITSSDIGKVIYVIERSFSQTVAPWWSEEAQDVFLKQDLSEEKVSKLVFDENICLKAVENKDIVGVLLFSSVSKLAHLFVKPSEYKKGIATMLFGAALKLVDERVEYLSLISTEVAVVAYERLGFKKSAPAFRYNGCIFQPMVYWMGRYRLASKVELIS